MCFYKDSFEAVSYEELSRYPDSYKGKKIKVTVYGVGDGTETIKTKERGLLWDKTVDKTEIPMVKIQYVEIK